MPGRLDFYSNGKRLCWTPSGAVSRRRLVLIILAIACRCLPVIPPVPPFNAGVLKNWCYAGSFFVGTDTSVAGGSFLQIEQTAEIRSFQRNGHGHALVTVRRAGDLTGQCAEDTNGGNREVQLRRLFIFLTTATGAVSTTLACQ